MNRLLVSALLLVCLTLGASDSEIKSVYLLPMSGGLDQYLANRLSGVFRVVTDPKLADAVFTDRLGGPFEQKLAELYPSDTAEEVDKDDKDGKKSVQSSNFGRGKGTIFLVDLKTRAVVWSSFTK